MEEMERNGDEANPNETNTLQTRNVFQQQNIVFKRLSYSP